MPVSRSESVVGDSQKEAADLQPGAAPVLRPSDPLIEGPTHPMSVLGLQRAGGNAAVSRMIARTRSADATLARTPITIPPVVISNDPATQAHEQGLVDEANRRAPELWRGYCRDWFAAATAALGGVPDLANPYESANMSWALAGNLAWAATSVTILSAGVAAPVGAAVVLVSVLGAAAGTGVMARGAPPSGRDRIVRALASERDRLEGDVPRSTINDLLGDLSATGQLESADAFDRAVWNLFSDSIPFESRTSVMTANATRQISGWVSQFQQQYLEWKSREDVISKARDYEADEQASGPYGDPFTLLAWAVGIGTPADQYFDMAMNDFPLSILFTG